MDNDLEIWEMAKIFGKSLRYIVHGLSIEKRHKYVANDLNIFNMASICGKRLQCIRNTFARFVMA